ncbi:MAG: DegT/DnrJ/EryC1/StrS family aminotransferase [Wolinella sp.]
MRSIPFFVSSVDDSELSEIVGIFNNKESKVVLLEEQLKKYIGAKYATSTNSGASAMHLCLCAMELKRGDKVICSVNCHPFIPEAIRYFDAEPIFVDVSETDFNLLPERCREILEKNDSKKLRGIIASHIGGQAADMEQLYALRDDFDIKIIEDATCAMGLEQGGKKIGSCGADATVFSFTPDSLNPIAQGGAIVTNDDSLAQKATLLRYHALVQDDDASEHLGYIYDVVEIGNKYDLPQLDAAYCLLRLQQLDKSIARRKEIAEIYDAELSGLRHLKIPARINEHIFSAYIVKIDKNRDGFARELRELGIATGLNYIPLHLLSYYKTKYELKVNHYPNALRNYQQVLSLPIHAKLTDDDVAYICEQIKAVDKGRI